MDELRKEVRTEVDSIWYVDNTKKIQVGFTADFLKNHQDCWHISPVGKSVEKGAPLLVVETNDALESIMSPFKGQIEEFSDKARNFPDQLTPEDVVCTINTLPGKATPKTPRPRAVPLPERAVQIDWGAELNRMTIARGATGVVATREGVGFFDEVGPPPVPRPPTRNVRFTIDPTVGGWTAPVAEEQQRQAADDIRVTQALDALQELQRAAHFRVIDTPLAPPRTTRVGTPAAVPGATVTPRNGPTPRRRPLV